jgi:hypothetical protein
MQNVLNNIYVGLVVNNKDPIKKGRVQVFIPHITNTLYTGWNEANKNIKFRTFDSDVFTPEITQRLIDILPWAEVAAPFFGGGTGAPVNTDTKEPTPIPTGPGEYMISQESYNTPAGNIPKRNIKQDGTVDVEKLDPKIKSDLVEFTKIFPDAVITSGAEGKPGDGRHSAGSEHYPQNSNDGSGKGFDLRIHDVPAEIQQKYVEFFATRGYQGIGYEKIDGVFNPNDHIHIQLTPLKGGGYGTFGPDGKSSSVSTLTPKWFQAFSKKMEAGDFKTSESRKNPPVAQNGLNNPSATISSESNTVKSSKSKEEVSKILKGQRQGFKEELADNKTKEMFYNIIDAEVGSYSDKDHIMFIESVMNRTYARRLEGNTLISPNYYGEPNSGDRTRNRIESVRKGESPPLSKDKIEKYDKLVNEVINTGSNLSNFATGNNQNSPKDRVGYAGGPEVAVGDRERFGIEGKTGERVTDLNWAKELGVNVDDLTPYDPKQGTKVAKQNHDLDGELYNGVAEIGNKGGAIGFLSVPHIGSKAYVMFLDGNHLRPIVIGAFKETSNG